MDGGKWETHMRKEYAQLIAGVTLTASGLLALSQTAAATNRPPCPEPTTTTTEVTVPETTVPPVVETVPETTTEPSTPDVTPPVVVDSTQVEQPEELAFTR